MRLLFFCFLILLSSAFSTPIAIHVPDAQSTGILRAGGRSLLSLSEQETELAARTDGTIVLRTINSKRVIWSFASGSPIYSSYQAPPTLDNGNEAASRPITAFFIDCGDDWELYAHATHSNKMKLPVTVEEFVKHMPHVSEEGAITVGSKRTTVYVVDAMTGKLLHVYRSPDSPSALEPDKEGTPLSDNGNGNKELTDYTLQSFHPNSDKVSWSLMVSEIGAALLCQDVKYTVNSSYEFPEIGNDFVLPFPCQSKGIVIREHNTTEYTSTSHHDDPMLPLSSSNAPTSLAKPDSTSDDRHNRKMLLVAAPESKLQLPHKVDRLLNLSQDNENETSVPQPPLENSDSRMFGVHDLRTPHADGHGKAIFSKYPVVFSFIFFIILVGFVINHVLLAKRLSALKDQPVANINIGSSNRKKSRRSGKINGSIEKKDQHTSSGSEDEFSPVGADNEKLLDLNKLVGSFDGRRIGKLIVLSKEIAKGSNGTIVLEGFYEGRAVAVKRLVQAHHDVAFKEIQNLIVSDQHPNIVRWYGVEYDQDFVYLALERCTCSLDDLIQIYSDTPGNSVLSKDPATRAMVEHKIHLDLVKGAMQDLNLWKANGHPSPLFLKLMRDVVSGLAHLHDLGIIHRDIKPQNVLIIKEKTVCAKLSDMGISKRLLEDRSSLGHHATGCGSSGWQAPEQLLLGRQTRAVDLFSLGCVLFFCITRGKHPFGNHLERDINVVNNRVNLFLVEHIPEAVDLISCLLNPEPELSKLLFLMFTSISNLLPDQAHWRCCVILYFGVVR
ncbi:hypothetical protein V6Z12_A02G213000 [Gossypium hirsutum]